MSAYHVEWTAMIEAGGGVEVRLRLINTPWNFTAGCRSKAAAVENMRGGDS
jgi:hypothetical protein